MSVYNTKKEFLDVAIQSILNQKFKDYEFIIVNDGSTEECLANILRYNDSRIRLLSNEYNIGLTKSLNRGLAIAKGKYIARMDADDYSYPLRLKKQYEYMERHTEIDILGSWVREGNKVKKSCGNVTSEWRYARMLFDNVGIYHPTAFIRADFLKKNELSYDEDILKAQDFELWTRCLKVGKMYVYPQVLVDYRIHEQQISRSQLGEQNNYNYIIRKRLISKLKIELNELEEKQFKEINIPILSAKEFERFIGKILEANEQCQEFSPNILKHELNTKWVLHMLSAEKKERKSYLQKEYLYHILSIKYCMYMLLTALHKQDLLRKNREKKQNEKYYEYMEKANE